jgi:hypothetical protein
MSGKVSQARAFFADAEVLVTVENTYRPELNGCRRQVTKAGASYFHAVLLDDVNERNPAGTVCHGNIPTRAGDIVAIDDEQITCKLGDIPRLAGHTVTMRKVTATEDARLQREAEQLADRVRAGRAGRNLDGTLWAAGAVEVVTVDGELARRTARLLECDQSGEARASEAAA